jgi:hypothetical protein
VSYQDDKKLPVTKINIPQRTVAKLRQSVYHRVPGYNNTSGTRRLSCILHSEHFRFFLGAFMLPFHLHIMNVEDMLLAEIFWLFYLIANISSQISVNFANTVH